MSTPIAVVERTMTTAGGMGCVRLQGSRGPHATWGANPDLWVRTNNEGASTYDAAEQLAADINAVHASVVDLLHAQVGRMKWAVGEYLAGRLPVAELRNVAASIETTTESWMPRREHEAEMVRRDKAEEDGEPFRRGFNAGKKAMLNPL